MRRMPLRNIVIGQKVTVAKVQAAKALRRDQTPEERLLWRALRTNRLRGLHFRRQQVIDGFIVDFYCHAAKLVVEVDGPLHDQQVESDAERERALLARGLAVLRVTNGEVRRDLPAVLARISACAENLLPFPCREGVGG